MHDLSPLTPLGNAEPSMETIGEVTLTEVTDVALASVAARLGREEDTRAALKKVIGADAPETSRHAGSTLRAFWTGPDQWMVEAPLETHEDLAKMLSNEIGAAASITEQTDAWCRFDLVGRDLFRALELLCAADTADWSGGEVQRCSIEHLGCFVLCRDPSTISILGPRSAAGSLHHALVTACHAAF
ncbi:sarcosine oxidase subunit gamma [Marivita sp. XM-24bin2]|uniref:sarcosine oxidase subunit gamma n=1 Tax=unclassified Marivita TaxID=2632480 RepID=UPI000D7B71C0|nr:sarcosine oxidase subunit gamma [Marivita sp. XM-24bin2]MCR9109069.1 sarcosine oxidase subunit gamma [Paracoccaceae bacterium]PWL36928.1 MAG: sarcosine oxidase subunit gamma [Marivita sp. XM-24bin2]